MAYVAPSEFDNNPDFLNCANGVVSLRTGEIEPHNPDQKFTYCSPIAYKPNADYTKWVDWLKKAVGSPEIADWLQIAVGYSLTGYTWEEILFYIFGPTRSGKGLFTETISSVLGTPLAQEINFSTFTDKRSGDSQNFDLAPLKAARLVSASESNAYERFNEAKIKALTGGNNVYCAFTPNVN
ncbi:MAG: phage/plasmid primase, P4 family [Caldilineaceae bacterium]